MFFLIKLSFITFKVLPCLRLKKKFSLTCTNEGPERVHPIKSGSRGEISDQLVELPLDNQVHDLIKAEGPKGLLFTEVQHFQKLSIFICMLTLSLYVPIMSVDILSTLWCNDSWLMVSELFCQCYMDSTKPRWLWWFIFLV